MAAKPEMEEMNSSESDDTLAQDDSEMALTGMYMLLNNGFAEAQALFEKYRFVLID